MALHVKKSKLPGAGKGLFIDKDIVKGKKIIEYRGRIIGRDESRRRLKNGMWHYMFYLRHGAVIRVSGLIPRRVQSIDIKVSRIRGLHNNSDYVVCGCRCFIVASRDIRAGEEILVSYTKSYWDYMKKNGN